MDNDNYRISDTNNDTLLCSANSWILTRNFEEYFEQYHRYYGFTNFYRKNYIQLVRQIAYLIDCVSE